MIKCDEINRKPRCRSGFKCVTQTATCVIAAASFPHPSTVAFVAPVVLLAVLQFQ